MSRSEDFLRAADAIWARVEPLLPGGLAARRLGNLQSIDVKVARKAVHLQVRRAR